MIVAWEHIRNDGPQHVEGCPVREAPLELHVVFDLIEGHVTGPLDHDLTASAPGFFRQLAQDLELAELRRVGRVGKASRPQTKSESYVEEAVMKKMTAPRQELR